MNPAPPVTKMFLTSRLGSNFVDPVSVKVSSSLSAMIETGLDFHFGLSGGVILNSLVICPSMVNDLVRTGKSFVC